MVSSIGMENGTNVGDGAAAHVANMVQTTNEVLAKGIERSLFVRRCAQSLQLSTAVTATALLLTHQYYARQRPSTGRPLDYRVMVGACIFIATKSCEAPRTLHSVVNVVHAVMNNTTEPLQADAAYSNLKNSLINAEQTVLRVLCFNVDVILPHTCLFNFCRVLSVSPSTVQCALALVNDVLLAPKSVDFPAPVIAASCLHLATQITQDACDNCGKWWYQFDTSDDDVVAIASLVDRISDGTTPRSLLAER